MKEERQNLGKIQSAILLRIILPMLLLGLVIAGVSVNRTRVVLEQQMRNCLETSARTVISAYDAIYPGDYILKGEQIVSLFKGDKELTDEHEIIDKIKSESGVEVTLFYLDTRILTTVTNRNGARQTATGVNAAVYRKMTEKPEPMFYEVDINGDKYYACYLPMFNADGSFVGMVGTAYSTETVKKEMRRAVIPIWVITILGMGLVAFISLNYTGHLIEHIAKIRNFLLSMVGGELGNELDESVMKRGDELSETGIALIKMQNAVRVLVERDPLTALYNRRYGNAKLKNLQLRTAKSGEPFAIAIGDIDFFKKVNDTYGHDAGDVILKHVADALKVLMAKRGCAVRWGGEEFLMMFENHTLGMAATAIKEFIEIIRNDLILYDKQQIRVTMTIGLVPGSPDVPLEELFREADEKLYYGKQNGRNQLVVDESLIQNTVVQSAADGSEVVLGFSDEFIDSENLMQLLTENMAKEAEQEKLGEGADGSSGKKV